MTLSDLILLLAVLGSLAGLWWVFFAGHRSDLETLAQINERRTKHERGAR